MSFDDLLSSHGRPAELDVELDITLLGSLVAESGAAPADDLELPELLAHLDSADTVATGVEAKLDEILNTLDDLLASFEPSVDQKPRGATIPPSESFAGRPPSEQS